MDRKRLQKIIIPLLLEQLLTVSVGMIDTFMVSTVGEAAVSGVALVDNINLLVIQVMAAFAAGGIVVISQYIGNKNEKMSLKSCAQLEVLMVLFCVAAILIWPLSYTLPNALPGSRRCEIFYDDQYNFHVAGKSCGQLCACSDVSYGCTRGMAWYVCGLVYQRNQLFAPILF